MLLALPGNAMLYVMVPDDALLSRSDAVVLGQVVVSRKAATTGRIETDHFIRVEQVVKGSAESILVIRQHGGVAPDGVAAGIHGVPMLQRGDRVLLFLEASTDGVHRLVDLGLGVLFEVPGETTTFTRRLDDSAEIALPKDPLAAARRQARNPRDAERFLIWLRNRARGIESPADYFVPGRETGPPGLVSLAQPYSLYRAACGTSPGPLARWPEFDQGKSVSLEVHATGSAGIPGGGFTEVVAGMAAWNRISGAGINFVSGGKTSNVASAATADGRNTILFEDPLDDISGSFDDEGGVAAVAFWHHDCVPHVIPHGTDSAVAITECDVVSQDGFGPTLARKLSTPGNLFEKMIGHELGHCLGLGHSCTSAELRDGTCPSPQNTSLMRAAVMADGQGAVLNSDDIAAVKALYPGSAATPPRPEPDPEPPASDCTLVAPYWSGPTGGFTVKPAPGSDSVSLTCGRRTTEYVAEDGLVTRLVKSSCRGAGLQLTGAAPGGWYWQHGDSNAAVAPLVCSDALAGPSAVVPGGVTADATDDGTLVRHDMAQLIGIVPHLAGNQCGEYVTPYWQGDGGVVVRPEEGRQTVRVRVQCGRTYSTMTPSAGEDGVIAELVQKSYCTDHDGNPKQGRLTVTGAAPGGWYWVDGERNAAVGPLMCADLLGGPAAVDPGGVFSRAAEDGTYFQHDASRLIGVVPHVAPNGDPPR